MKCSNEINVTNLLDAKKYDVWARSLQALTRWQVVTTCVCGWSTATSKPSVCSNTFSLKTRSCACSWYELVCGSGGGSPRLLCSIWITISSLRGCSSTWMKHYELFHRFPYGRASYLPLQLRIVQRLQCRFYENSKTNGTCRTDACIL